MLGVRRPHLPHGRAVAAHVGKAADGLQGAHLARVRYVSYPARYVGIIWLEGIVGLGLGR